MPELKPVLIEGFTPDEILQFTDEQIEAMFLTGNDVVLRIGSAEALGRFNVVANSLVMELAHIDGGGEGVWLACDKDTGEVNRVFICHRGSRAKPDEYPPFQDVPMMGPVPEG